MKLFYYLFCNIVSSIILLSLPLIVYSAIYDFQDITPSNFPEIKAYSFRLNSVACVGGSRILTTHLDPETHYIFTPNSQTTVRRVMLYFHGNGSYTFDEFCSGNSLTKEGAQILGACHAITENPNTAIIVLKRPNSISSSGSWFNGISEEETTCLISELTNVLARVRIPDEASIVYGGWGHGGGTIKNLISYLPISTVSLFDACYSNWCETIIQSPNAQNIFFYNDSSTDTEGTAAYRAIALNPTKATSIITAGKNHNQIPAICALDAISDGDPCYGLGIRDTIAGTGPDNNSPTTRSSIIDTINIENIRLGFPNLAVKIPGLNFSANTKEDLIYIEGDGNVYIKNVFLAEYIAALFRYSIGIIIIVTSIIIIVSGLQWMTSGSGDGISHAKTRISTALVGLILALTSYTVLFIINPNLTKLSTLKILLIQREDLFDHGAIEVDNQGNIVTLDRCPWGEPGTVPNNFSREIDTCLYNEYLSPTKIGERVPTHRIENPLGIQGARARVLNHPDVIAAWEAAFREIQNSNNPEIIGLLRWMQDYSDRNAPDLAGYTDGAGLFSALFTELCYNKSQQPISSIVFGMHTHGFALDIMTRSNWDVRTPASRSTKGRPIETYCRGLDRSRNGNAATLYTNRAYNLARIGTKLDACLQNPTSNTNIPWTTFPDEFIRAFERQGIYWGGYGWGDPNRSDAMHFEFYGKCCHLSNSCRSTVGSRFPQYATGS
jgi:hypothetical protein